MPKQRLNPACNPSVYPSRPSHETWTDHVRANAVTRLLENRDHPTENIEALFGSGNQPSLLLVRGIQLGRDVSSIDLGAVRC